MEWEEEGEGEGERSGEETEKLGARARGKRKEGGAVDTPTGEVKSNGRLKRVTG